MEAQVRVELLSAKRDNTTSADLSAAPQGKVEVLTVSVAARTDSFLAKSTNATFDPERERLNLQGRNQAWHLRSKITG